MIRGAAALLCLVAVDPYPVAPRSSAEGGRSASSAPSQLDELARLDDLERWLASSPADPVPRLAELASSEADRAVRHRAIEALGEVGGAGAGAALLELMAEAPGDEAALAAEALAEAEGVSRALAEALMALAVPADDPRRIAPPAPEVEARLLSAYGPVIAELGAVGPEQRAPLVRAARSGDPRLRSAAESAIDGALSRFGALGWPPAAERFVEGLIADGHDARELDYRRAVLALSAGTAPELAFDPAARLKREALLGEGFEAWSWAFRGHYVAALAEFALGRLERVEPELAAALALIRRLRAQRLELRVAPDSVDATTDARTAGELIVLEALVEWTRLWLELAAGLSADDERALALGARVHLRLLEAERIQVAWGAPRWADSFDAVLQRPEGPRRILLGNPVLPRWSTAALLDLQRRALSVLAAVAPEELPGIAPSVADGRGHWSADAARRALVADLRRAELVDVTRRIALDRVNRGLWAVAEGRLVERLREDSESGGRSAYLDYRAPSLAALDLARDLRSDGDPSGALAVAERLAADLERAELVPRGTDTDEFAALAAREAGAALTDLDRPDEAQARLSSALERYEAIGASIEERLAEARAGRVGARRLERRDEVLISALERGLEGNRRSRADVLTALAVNANVRLGDGDRALAYFERAYELDSSTFARVLLACYRARAGRFDEARFLLADVTPAPELHYNLACTHALLGDREQALEFLQLELESPRQSEGGRARQREWAAIDPDLASLRGDPRFEALIAAGR